MNLEVEDNMNKYNEAIMQAVRQYRGLDENDTSADIEILNMPKENVFREYCLWNGLLGNWYYDLLSVIEDIYNIKLMEEY